jgi:hypothetical protein
MHMFSEMPTTFTLSLLTTATMKTIIYGRSSFNLPWPYMRLETWDKFGDYAVKGFDF